MSRDNWLLILILSMLQWWWYWYSMCYSYWLTITSLYREKTIGWWYWYSLCYSYLPIVTALCEQRQLVGDTDSFYVTVTDQLSLHMCERRDNWLGILIRSGLLLLTNCHFALWEKTIGWWYCYSLCYSYWQIVTALCEKRNLVGDTDTLYVTVTAQS